MSDEVRKAMRFTAKADGTWDVAFADDNLPLLPNTAIVSIPVPFAFRLPVVQAKVEEP